MPLEAKQLLYVSIPAVVIGGLHYLTREKKLIHKRIRFNPDSFYLYSQLLGLHDTEETRLRYLLQREQG